MKKLLLLLSTFVLLAACESPVTNTTPGDPEDEAVFALQTVFGIVQFIDEDTVTFTTDLTGSGRENDQTYRLSKDAVIKVIQGGMLVELAPEHYMDIFSSSNYNDYHFYFVLNGDEVLEMTQANMILEADLNSNDDLVYVTGVFERDGAQFVSVDPIVMIGSPDCTNTHEVGLPECNPNGFLIQNETVEATEYEVSSEGESFFLIDWVNYTEFPPSKPMMFNEFKDYFAAHQDYFQTIPFHLQTYEESSGLIFKSLVERYIP